MVAESLNAALYWPATEWAKKPVFLRKSIMLVGDLGHLGHLTGIQLHVAGELRAILHLIQAFPSPLRAPAFPSRRADRGQIAGHGEHRLLPGRAVRSLDFFRPNESKKR